MKYRLVCAAMMILVSAPLVAQSDWTTMGHDAGQTKYSPLSQINTTNVSKLEQAWVYHLTPATPPATAPGARPIKRSTQAVPLVANGIMYLPTPYSTVLALQPESGKLIWTYKLEQSSVQGRTLVYWPGDKTTPASLLFGTADSRLVSINAKTGMPTTGFGENGAINLKKGMNQHLNAAGQPDDTQRYYMTSPGSIYKDLIITGADLQETPGRGPAGDIRAWDLHTGKMVWIFHTVARAGEPGNETWSKDGWQARSGANMWGFSSVDSALGLVYIPIGSPASDNWGGDREGNNLYGDSLVALHADTGKIAWYFQAVHHDIFDYDLESAPVLITIHRKTGDIPGVAVTSKTGLMFIFDRRNGKPIYGVEERPVPQSTAPGEYSSPTQPFPIKPVQLGRGGFDPNDPRDMSDVTPEHTAFCRNMLATEGGMQGSTTTFTPYGQKLTIIFPSTVGISNWYGMSYNPKLGYLFINTNDMGSIGKIAPTKPGADPPYDRTSPWGTYAEFSENSKEWPCQAPPWGELWAIDVQHRRTSHGSTPLAPFPNSMRRESTTPAR